MFPEIANAVFGVWLIAAPGVLGYAGPAAIDHRVVGPLATATGLIAAWDATRPVGRLNVALGLSLIATAWAPGFGGDAFWNGVAVGIALAALALVDRRTTAQFGAGWSGLVASRRGERPAPPSR